MGPHTPWEWHAALFAEARNAGILCFSSPFDKTSIDFLEQFDPPAYKIASFEITDYEFIRYAASKGRPMIISTGIASIEEIHEAVIICREEGIENLALLHCTSAYPTPLEEANLKMIPNMRETFGVEVGYSDHTFGITAPVAATILGAQIIEKHFIYDKNVGGPDVDFSLDRNEFAAMVQAVSDAQKLSGSVDYGRNKKGRQFARSLYAAKAIQKGEVFSRDNIRCVRPGFGLHPRYLGYILGKTADKNYETGDRLSLI